MLADLLGRGWLDSLHAQLSWGVGTIDRTHEHDQAITKVDSACNGVLTNTLTFPHRQMALSLAYYLHLIPPLVQR